MQRFSKDHEILCQSELGSVRNGLAKLQPSGSFGLESALGQAFCAKQPEELLGLSLPQRLRHKHPFSDQQ